MKNNIVHIVFSGGGTGGHLFPGLAVAEQLSAMIPRLRITFCGGGKSFERQAVSKAGFEYFALPSRPLPNAAREAVSFVVENLAGYLAARRFLREERVSAVVGLGGYASAAMARAASRRDVPLVLLEQNAVAGRASRWLARRATLICTAFAETAAGLRCHCPVRVTGNPIRFGFDRDTRLTMVTIPARTEREAAGNPSPPLPISPSPRLPVFASPGLRRLLPPRQLLVLGGSGGARSLNENVPRALYKVRRQLAEWYIVHQSGQADLDATKTLYRKFDLPATVVPFIEDMPAMLRTTDLAVCRAGGTTLAELAAAAVPSVLLPYPHAADDHQLANARAFSAGGGCVTIDERQISDRLDDRLADMLCFLLANEALRRRMSAAMHQLARPTAAQDVAELIWSVVSSQSVQAQAAAV
ncbi:MAG: UDP-N-acetylglucosamine--N-acetylmuramyl-(pentapeptide) pyrophosphoryl-undecaprenol N-acetylglucosamine transferase [Thermoguttaceae bacterium]